MMLLQGARLARPDAVGRFYNQAQDDGTSICRITPASRSPPVWPGRPLSRHRNETLSGTQIGGDLRRGRYLWPSKRSLSISCSGPCLTTEPAQIDAAKRKLTASQIISVAKVSWAMEVPWRPLRVPPDELYGIRLYYVLHSVLLP